MNKYIYVLRDKKLGSYQEPLFDNEDPEHYAEGTSRGVRLITDPVQKVRARDMALYHIGLFDDVTGKFVIFDEPQKLIDYEDFIEKSKEA